MLALSISKVLQADGPQSVLRKSWCRLKVEQFLVHYQWRLAKQRLPFSERDKNIRKCLYSLEVLLSVFIVLGNSAMLMSYAPNCSQLKIMYWLIIIDLIYFAQIILSISKISLIINTRSQRLWYQILVVQIIEFIIIKIPRDILAIWGSIIFFN